MTSPVVRNSGSPSPEPCCWRHPSWCSTMLSAVDAHTEQQILHALKAHKRTLILVSHRMTAVEQADEILVLEEGHISERVATAP